MIPSRIGPYVLEKKLGKGSYGIVYKATHEKTGINVAIKIIPKSQLEHDQSRLRFSREVSLLQRIDHPFVPRFYQLIEDSQHFYLVMEFVSNGDLVSIMKPTDEYTAKRLFLQLIVILEYLHKDLRIAHRDLKAENVMLDKYNNIRLIDYGLSNCFTDNNPHLKTACGSACYIPPEVVKKQKYTSSVDVWSAGILLYSLTVGRLPFDDENVSNVLQKIVYADPYMPPTVSPDLADLLKKMLMKQPEKRITINKIKEHPWFSLSEYQRIAEFCRGQSCSTAQIQSTGSHRTSINDTKIDPDIVSKMKELGIDTTSLKQNLFMKNYSEKTAVYDMLKRQKLIEEMKEEMKIMPKNRPSKLQLIVGDVMENTTGLASTPRITSRNSNEGAKRPLLSPRIVSSKNARMQNIQKRFSHEFKNSSKKRNS